MSSTRVITLLSALFALTIPACGSDGGGGPSEGECDTFRDCAAGEICRSHTCYAACAFDDDCPDDMTCEAGVCSSAAECGNGLVEAGETCDDRNETAGDGCDACAAETGWVCREEPSICRSNCGDGVVASGEDCDDDNGVSGDGCSAVCTVEDYYDCDNTSATSVCTPICGDGELIAPEVCEDGDTNDGDGCSATCQLEEGWDCTTGVPTTCNAVCPDGFVRDTEECDDDNVVLGDGCEGCVITPGWSCDQEPSVCTMGCGNGVIDGSEECDDDNAIDGDGCTTCMEDAGYVCTGAGVGSCVPECGDGTLTGGQECDDGNTTPNDGCSDTCTEESGWTCVGAGAGSCTPICGDGQVVDASECEDTNVIDGDGCSAACEPEVGWICQPGYPSVCDEDCGDGIIVGDEVCDDGNTVGGDDCEADCLSGACTVPSTYTTIQEAITNSTCPVISIDIGTYNENLSVTRDVELVGVGVGAHIVSGAVGGGSVVDISTPGLVVVLEDLIIESGDGALGAGIFNAGDLTLRGALVRFNSATSANDAQGGGIYTIGTDLTLEDTVVENNTVDGDVEALGGGIYASTTAVKLIRSQVRTNQLIADGGAPARAMGAGVFLDGASLELDQTSAVDDNILDVILLGATASILNGFGAGIGGTLSSVLITGGSSVSGNLLSATCDPDCMAIGAGIGLLGGDLSITDGSALAGNEVNVTCGAAACGLIMAAGAGLYLRTEDGTASTLDITDSSVTDNMATAATGSGVGIAAAAGVSFEVSNTTSNITANIERSTIAGNVLTGEGMTRGGGIFGLASGGSAFTNVTITNSTISGNDAQSSDAAAVEAAGAGLFFVVSATTSISNFEISNCTITGNVGGAGNPTAASGAGLYWDAEVGFGAVTLRNTILAGNTADAGGDCANAQEGVTSAGFNLIGLDDSCTWLGDVTNDLTGIDPNLPILADNGGLTRTHAIDAGHPATDTGNPAGCLDAASDLLTTDQRGEDRHTGGLCDIGAYEYVP